MKGILLETSERMKGEKEGRRELGQGIWMEKGIRDMKLI